MRCSIFISLVNLLLYRAMYEKLAVFLDDDPIHSAALEVLWDVERYEVKHLSYYEVTNCKGSVFVFVSES